jgi:hypothetical protein
MDWTWLGDTNTGQINDLSTRRRSRAWCGLRYGRGKQISKAAILRPGQGRKIVPKESAKRRRNLLSLWAEKVHPHAKSDSTKWPTNHQRHKHKAMAVVIARGIADPDQAMQPAGDPERGCSEIYERHDLS